MAGTRRRSRIISDAPAQRDQAQAEDAKAPRVVVEVPDSVDGGSGSGPELQSPESRSTTGTCKQCKAFVGNFFNSWHKITGTYFLPSMTSSYESKLRPHGKQKAATIGTDLGGCTIQPLACPRCSDLLGFTAVDVPASKQPFRGRDFFKLSRIELRCKTASDPSQIVEPHVDVAPELPVRDTDRSSPAVAHQPPNADMEVDTRMSHAPQPPPPPPSGPTLQARQEHHHHAPLQQVEANRQSLPPPLRSPSVSSSTHALPQKSPSNPPLPSPSPAVKPVHDVQFAQPPSRESTIGLANRARDHPPVMSHSHSPAEQNRANGHYYPRSPKEVSLDAIERLQTQFSQNSAALVAQGREMQSFKEAAIRQEENLRHEFQNQLHQNSTDIRRVEQAVGRLELEMHDIRELLTTLTREVHATRELQAHRSMGQGAPGISAQDSALELMAQQVAVISQKANEVDTLKITIEIMKNKIQRLEDTAAAAPSQSSTHPFPSPREPTAHSAHSSHTVTSYHATPSAVPPINTSVHPVHRPGSFHSHGSHFAVTPEVSQRAEPAPTQTQSGWASVNKRPHPNGAEGPHDSLGQPVGSPKRPKLAPIEPRSAFGASQVPSQQNVVYDSVDTDNSESRFQAHSHSLPPQTQSRESILEASPAQSTLASQHSQHSAYVSYGTQDGPTDDSWQPESQHIEHRTPRGRGRGGGPGSRGGRGRKSMPVQTHLGTPEWERDDWQGITESQTSPDGYYNHAPNRSGRGIIRRGSGGGGGVSRGRPSSSSGRAINLGMQGVTTGVSLPMDPYSHTKKTRTKPTRNADGVLIRKDGRPDMRSQSSAANLRKVHARKEEQKEGERDFTPTSSLYQTTNAEPSTPSPTHFLLPGQDVTASVQKKHNLIMGKMFPGGVDEARKEHDYARKVFEEEQRHTAQPREQHHHHHHHHHQSHPDVAEGRLLQIKREQADSQSSNDGDVDMDHADDHADDESQSPSDQSETSAQYHDATNNEAEPTQHQPKEAAAIAQSTTETSQTAEVSTT